MDTTTLLSWFEMFREAVSIVTPLQLGILAGLLQVIGYTLYIRKTLRSEIEPNPATWLMFAYGTTLLTILELDADAGWSLLLLPITCSVMGFYVAYLCWHRGRLSWPEDLEDQIAFIADLFLTGAYVFTWYMLTLGTINADERETLAILFLVFSNMTTVTAFIPLLRGAHSHPHKERPLAWIVWTSAYVVLGIATVQEHGFDTVLLIYPVSSAFLHGLVAWLSRRTRRRPRRRRLARA
jgi:hypothetical protein